MSEAATVEAPTAGAPPSIPQPFQDSFADLDQMATPPEESEKPKPPPKGQDNLPPVDKGEVEKPEEQKPKEPPPKPEDKGKPAKPPSRITELSKAYEALKVKHRQLEQDMIARNTELDLIRNKPPSEDPEKKTLKDRLEAAEKRVSELDNEVRFSNYAASQEYKDKYETPFIDAWAQGRAKTASLKVTDDEGNVRQGTKEDFDRIAQIPDDDQAAEVANELFGTKASVVLYHRERVQELNASRARAIEDFRKQGAERNKKVEEQSKQRGEQLFGLFNKLNTDAAEKYPHLFKPVDGDDKGNELLQKGFDLADLAFGKGADKIPVEKLVAAQSSVRNRAAAFGRLLFQKKALEAKVSELEKELGQYRESEPGAGAGDGKSKSTVSETWEQELDKLARTPEG